MIAVVIAMISIAAVRGRRGVTQEKLADESAANAIKKRWSEQFRSAR